MSLLQKIANTSMETAKLTVSGIHRLFRTTAEFLTPLNQIRDTTGVQTLNDPSIKKEYPLQTRKPATIGTAKQRAIVDQMLKLTDKVGVPTFELTLNGVPLLIDTFRKAIDGAFYDVFSFRAGTPIQRDFLNEAAAKMEDGPAKQMANVFVKDFFRIIRFSSVEMRSKGLNLESLLTMRSDEMISEELQELNEALPKGKGFELRVVRRLPLITVLQHRDEKTGKTQSFLNHRNSCDKKAKVVTEVLAGLEVTLPEAEAEAKPEPKADCPF